MTTYSPGTLVLLDFPNTDGTFGKPRPALVIADTGDDDIVVARLTSQLQQTQLDVAIVDWSAAGLRQPSSARVHKLATMHKSSIRHKIGTIGTADRDAIRVALATLVAPF
jgi:mRNA interferase MazF